MQASDDRDIFQLAESDARVIVSADTDFGTLLALGRVTKPSVIIFRRTSDRRPEAQTKLLLDCLPDIRESLESGSVVIIEDTRLRIRSLPIGE